jgi:hypothetical protein
MAMPAYQIFQHKSTSTDSTALKTHVFESIVFSKDTAYIYKSSDEIPLNEQLFSELSYEPQEINIIKETAVSNSTDNLLLIMIFLGFIIMALIRNVLNVSLDTPMLRMIQYRSSVIKETGSARKLIETSFYIMFLVGLSIFVTQALQYFDIEIFGLEFIYTGFVIGLFVLISIALFKIINHTLFYIFEDISFLQYNKTLDIHITGISIPLFLTAAAQYPVSGILNEVLLYAGLSLLFLSYLIKITKYIYINYLNKLRFYYLFLYLCALEAVPLLIIIKLYTAQ